jgi:streptomycin 6-kinase
VHDPRVPPFELPRTLVESLDAPSPDRDELRLWIADLPRLVAAAATRWSLRVEAPMQPGGVASYVARARTAADAPVVLKLGWLHEEALHEADALALWDGDGAVRLLDAELQPRTNVLLLEACLPGTRLADAALAPHEQDVVLADLLPRLWIEPPAAHPFRPLEQMCELWADRFDSRIAACPLDPELARAGAAQFRSLPRSAPRRTLLCTDIHPGNILAAEREPWLAIDPKPYVGDPAYDALQHMLNFPARLEADPDVLCTRMAGLLGLDADRLRAWVLARCVIESLDAPVLARVAQALARSGS